jgi:hypothetical protein
MRPAFRDVFDEKKLPICWRTQNLALALLEFWVRAQSAPLKFNGAPGFETLSVHICNSL